MVLTALKFGYLKKLPTIAWTISLWVGRRLNHITWYIYIYIRIYIKTSLSLSIDIYLYTHIMCIYIYIHKIVGKYKSDKNGWTIIRMDCLIPISFPFHAWIIKKKNSSTYGAFYTSHFFNNMYHESTNQLVISYSK